MSYQTYAPIFRWNNKFFGDETDYMIDIYRGWTGILLSSNPAAFLKTKFIPIHYSGFWDVPEAFFTEYKSEVYLFHRYFDEVLDDYTPNYEVYIYKNFSLENAIEQKFWFPHNYEDKVFVGEIPTAQVIFDRTIRKFVNTIVFEMIEPKKRRGEFVIFSAPFFNLKCFSTFPFAYRSKRCPF